MELRFSHLKNTAFEYMDCDECREWLSSAIQVYAGDDTKERKDKKITKLALMFTM